jgi:hypothetical protein
MVGDKKWQERITRPVDFVKTAAVRYFDLADRQQALNWVQE